MKKASLFRLLILSTAVLAGGVRANVNTYYFIGPDSVLAEVVVPDTVFPQAPDASWRLISITELHSISLYSPSEYEAMARQQGNFWTQETDGNTRESGWYVVGQSGNTKWIVSGGTSERIWYRCWPGRVYVKTELFMDGYQNPVSAGTANFDLAYKATIVTWPRSWTDGSVHRWQNKTTHWYGSNWIYLEWQLIYW
ncbi:MAG: hypothetical protein ABIK48_01750 [candidate division WOR-3 bacterium]